MSSAVIPIASGVTGLVSLLYALYLARWVLSRDPGNEKMRSISELIASGARTYLNRQFKTIIPILIVLTILIGLFISSWAALSFLAGALGSMLAGYLGMYVTTRSASRTAEAAKKSLDDALKVSWRAGAVMGLSLAGVALIIISLLYILYTNVTREWAIPLVATGFGASLVTLFMRVGGGIYTKAADLGADLVGKVEKGIPEDDPRNPGVIADNVGDNVGDVAGMAADVFESYIVTITATIFLAEILGLGEGFIVVPLLYGAVVLIATFLGVAFIKTRNVTDPMRSVSGSLYLTTILSIALVIVVSLLIMPGEKALLSSLAVVLGIILTPIILRVTEYYTSHNYGPVRRIADQARISAATVILEGYSTGLISAIPVITAISIVLAVSYVIGVLLVGDLVSSVFGEYKILLAGVYGTALASTGLLSMAGIVITADSFGPVSDNASGVVEMADLPDEVRERTDKLDMVGNTTKASTKGYAITSAAIAALVLFIALIFEIVKIIEKIIGLDKIKLESLLSSIVVVNPNLLIGVFVGIMIVYVFSSRTLSSVSRTAMEVVEEIRRQFRENPGILEWKAKPDYSRVIDITTKRALEEFLRPGLIAIITPVVTGVVLGWQGLVGVILGALVVGIPRALLMANSGGAWDNAKKYIELSGRKGSDEHKAAVIGDTVGDPFKDTTGPSLNPLIKVLNTLSVVFAPAIVKLNMLLGISVLSGLLPIILHQ